MSTQQQYQELEQEEFLLGPINGVLGGLPVAEQNQDYFLVFKGVGGTGPEIIDNTAYFIQYVVDSDGNVSKPSQGSIARLNIIQNFPTGKTTTVRIDNASGINTQLDGDHAITGLGIQQPILYTQFGIPSSSYTTDISFTALGGAPSGSYGAILNFRGLMIITSSTSATPGDITAYSVSGSRPDIGAATLNLNTGAYTVNSSSSLQSITFNPTIGFTNNHPSEVRSAAWCITRNGSDIPSTTAYLNLLPNESNTSTISYTEPLSNLGGNPVYKLKIITGGSVIDKDFVQFNISSQNPSPTNNTNASSGLWTTGSSTSTWLTASTYLSQNYGNLPNELVNATNFGFSPIKTPFLLNPGDRIRFEYNPQKDFIIYEVIEPRAASDALLKIKLSSIVPSNTILDNFVLHRVDNTSIKYIILDVAKDPTVDNPENPFTGIILPKYPSEKLKNNLENILSKLKQEGIIEN